jgi:3-oxoacyl-[acyl-carrier protein] reductase
MDLGLKGKVALVLAASKGLGRASAAALAAEGANLVIGARTAPELEKTAREIQLNSGNRVLAVPVDVTQFEQVEAIVTATIQEFGQIDILVNNAGGPPFGSFETFGDAEWQAAFELNLLSAVRFSRLVLPHMRRTGSGRIINIISLSVKTLLEGSVLSTSFRMGVVGLAKLLAEELGPDNITVNNVAPGIILTDRVREASLKEKIAQGMSEEEALDERAKQIPLRRVGKPEELAALVAFLASQQAAYITGATIQVDGGLVRSLY